jgi:two-component SAPR family response regulator
MTRLRVVDILNVSSSQKEVCAMARPPTRVVIVSSAALFRDGLRLMLEESARIQIIGCVDGWEGALDLVRHTEPDAVVLDRDDRMPPRCVDQLFAVRQQLRVVLLSLHDDRLTVYSQDQIWHPRRPQLVAAVLNQRRRRMSNPALAPTTQLRNS